MRRIFEDFSMDSKPCPVCLELANNGKMQKRAVMPLPKFPPRLRLDNRQCCRDCQATETTMVLLRGQHPDFVAARLTIANERIEGTLMPFGMMEKFGLCHLGYIMPSSLDNLKNYLKWLEINDIENNGNL